MTVCPSLPVSLERFLIQFWARLLAHSLTLVFELPSGSQKWTGPGPHLALCQGNVQHETV